jgi:hypothetical protein
VSYEVLALVTNRGKQRFQEAIRLGYALQVTHFVVGNQGHDPNSPITALTPDPGFDPTPDAVGNRIPEDATIQPLAVTSAEDDPNFATVWTCDLPKGVATGEISSVYLLAKTVYPVTHPEFDLLFPYAIGFLPLAVKVDNERTTFRVGVQY